jgi:predicted aldo/keto reductase-like oxidoreductase
MKKERRAQGEKSGISRRRFVKTGGAALAGGAALGGAPLPAEGETPTPGLFPSAPPQEARIRAYKTLGRTGFQVSDVGMGSVPLRETAVVRYAYDRGVNYFDTAEGYGNGAAERAIGEAMQHMDRERIFVASKARIRPDDSAQDVVTKVRRSLERLRTEYLDAYSIHGGATLEALNHAGFHAAMDQLKAEGRVRFRGVSYHGPRGPQEGSMGDVLCAAAEDGRFDMMLLVYNFMNHEEGDRILAACKANNVGATGMKTSPGLAGFEPVDPDDLTEQQERYVQRFMGRGQTREAAVQRLVAQSRRQQETYERTRPFAERYGVQTQEQLRLGSIHWVLQNPDMHTACVAFTEFSLVDRVVPLSGTALGEAEGQMLQALKLALNDQYCRHGCYECAGQCPDQVPVSTIMRYAYYYEGQGLEKHAMSLYAGLGGPDASPCQDCVGHCSGACRYGIDIQPNMLQVHDLLTLA